MAKQHSDEFTREEMERTLHSAYSTPAGPPPPTTPALRLVGSHDIMGYSESDTGNALRFADTHCEIDTPPMKAKCHRTSTASTPLQGSGTCGTE